jgi:hypothetical protein
VTIQGNFLIADRRGALAAPGCVGVSWGPAIRAAMKRAAAIAICSLAAFGAAFALAYSPARVRVITVRAHAHVDRAALAALRAATDAARLSAPIASLRTVAHHHRASTAVVRYSRPSATATAPTPAQTTSSPAATYTAPAPASPSQSSSPPPSSSSHPHHRHAGGGSGSGTTTIG